MGSFGLNNPPKTLAVRHKVKICINFTGSFFDRIAYLIAFLVSQSPKLVTPAANSHSSKSRRRLKSRVSIYAAASGVAILVGLYIGVLPHVQAAGSPLVHASDLYQARLNDVAITTWCFWVGSSIGSFLNVVAWRMPRGESISGRSHCPRCLDHLRTRDNLPVFGWLALGGRCYSCKLPISVRYPIVEAIVGVSFTSVVIAEIYHLNLPGLANDFAIRHFYIPLVNLMIPSVLLFHVYAVSVSWAFGLIAVDRNRLPLKLVGWGIIPLIFAILLMPHLAVTTWRIDPGPSPILSGMSLHIDALMRVLTSVVAAALIGRTLARGLCPAADPKLDPLGKSTGQLIDVILVVSVPSLIVGWHSTLAVVVVAAILAVTLVKRLFRLTDAVGAFALAIPVATTLQICFWDVLQPFMAWPSSDSPREVIIGWGFAVLVTPWWLKQSSVSSNASVVPANVQDDDFEENEDDAVAAHNDATANDDESSV